MPEESELFIWSVASDRPIYVGADPVSGHLNSLRISGFNVIGELFRWIGPAATLALGLTECCAHFGRGKVKAPCIVA